MVKRYRELKAIGYFVTFTLVIYASSILYGRLVSTPGLLSRLLMELSGFVALYLVVRVFYGNPFGFNPFASNRSLFYTSPYVEGLTHVLALLLLGNVIPVIIIVVSGASQIYLDAKPSFVAEWNSYLPWYALAHWTLVGLTVAYFFHSATYELFGRKNRFIGVVSSATLFAINYNLPLISAHWNMWDILFFGLAFSYSYSVKRNPLALLTAYLLSEVPMWWCILSPLGERVFALYFFLRFALSVGSFIILVRLWLKRKKDCR